MAEVADGTEVVAAVDRHQPDVVLMDIRMPRMDGLAATELLRARRHPPEVIVLTTFDSDDHVLRAMRAGASGFLLKHTPPPEIVRAIRLVAAGEPMLSPTVLRRMMSYVAGADPRRHQARESLKRLADGELAVAKLIAQGRTNHEISRELFMSTATVKAYVSRMLAKLELNNRVQIALLVHDAALTDPPRLSVRLGLPAASRQQDLARPRRRAHLTANQQPGEGSAMPAQTRKLPIWLSSACEEMISARISSVPASRTAAGQRSGPEPVIRGTANTTAATKKASVTGIIGPAIGPENIVSRKFSVATTPREPSRPASISATKTAEIPASPITTSTRAAYPARGLLAAARPVRHFQQPRDEQDQAEEQQQVRQVPAHRLLRDDRGLLAEV